MYTVELRRGNRLRKGWTGVTGYQQTDIEEDSPIVEDGVMTSGIKIELIFDSKPSVVVKMPDDGDKLWFMDPKTGSTARSIQYDKDQQTKVFRTGERESEAV